MKTLAYERLTAQDASFLYSETDRTPMHVGGWLVFEGAPFRERGAFPIEDVRRQIASRLHRVPRYRKKLLHVPMAHPVLVDDPDFDVMYHVRHTALPEPGSWEQQVALFTRIETQKLDPTKPLWEMWFVEGLEGDRVGLIIKTHHTLIDGVSSMDVLSVLMDSEPDPPPVETPPWDPDPTPDPIEVAMDLLRRQQQMGGLTPELAEALSPAAFAKRWEEIGQGLATMAGMSLIPQTSLNVPVGRHRSFASVHVPLDDVREAKRDLGGTVNDVVLTAVAGGLRRLLLGRGEDVAGLELRAFVPVSVRETTERGALGNRVAAMFVPLPLGIDDPVELLRRITESTKDLKEKKQAVSARYLTDLQEFQPPALFATAARMSVDQSMVNLTVTNVPGPQHPLYFMGAELVGWHPMVPLSGTMTVGIPVISYNGTLAIGIWADRDSTPDIGVLEQGIRDTIAALQAAGQEARGR